jgi:Fe-S cluster assembly protein SufB
MNDVILKNFGNEYKYGFSTVIENESFLPGLNEEIIKNISKKKEENLFLLNFRLKAYLKWKSMHFPEWSSLKIPQIYFDDIVYYSSPIKSEKLSSLDEVDPELLKTFKKLGIPLNEQDRLANVAVDAVFDSSSIATTYKEKLGKEGVIFCSISDAIRFYPKLVKQFLGRAVSSGDNYFAALNAAVFTDGSFCYIPKDVKCPLELSTYFRINDKDSGQFERTLIIAEKNSSLSYLEGCTAPKYDKNQLHAATVELIAFENAKIKYSTVQNWYSGDENGLGGIYNFVTKRALCLGQKSEVLWTQVETGSAITWKYPSCVLLGDSSQGEFYSIAMTKHFQQADTGTKMIHLAPKTFSKIISKGISSHFSKNTYRGLVKMSSNASNSRNYSQCDSFLIGSTSIASTYPYIDVSNSTCLIEHEASVSRLNEDQIFYLKQRGLNQEQALSLIVNGFCKEVLNTLPLEFSTEANQLLSLKLEGSLG